MIHIRTIRVEGLPQSVSCSQDPKSNLVLVTDIERNKILKFKGTEPGKPSTTMNLESIYIVSSLPDGEWKPREVTFLVPRYVLLLPGDQVAVLDNRALYIFESDGRLLRKILENEAETFRGLAYYRKFNRIVRYSYSNLLL